MNKVDKFYFENAVKVPLVDYLTVVDCQEDENISLFFIDDCKKAYYGFGFELQPMILSGTNTVDSFHKIIKGLAKGTIVQSMMMSLPNVSKDLNEWFVSRNQRKGSEHVVVNRYHFLKKKIMDGRLPGLGHVCKKTCYLMFKVPVKKIGSQKEVSFLKDKILEIKASLSIFHPKIIRYDDYSKSLYHILNLQQLKERPDIIDNTKNRSLKNLVDRSTQHTIGKDSILMTSGERKNQFSLIPMTTSQYPEQINPHSIGQLMGDIMKINGNIPYPFILYTNILIEDKAKLSSYKAREVMIRRQLLGGNDSLLFKSLLEWKENLKAFQKTLKDEGLIPCSMYTGINLYCDPEETVEASEMVVKHFDDYGFSLDKEDVPLPIFLNSLPFNFSAKEEKMFLRRFLDAHSYLASLLSIVQGAHIQTPACYGGMALLSRTGGFAPFNFKRAGGDNKNFIVFGGSGAGKSFFTNDLINSFFTEDQNAVVRIFDSGGSYQAQTEIHEGQKIRFDPNKKLSINPFYDVDEKLFNADRDFFVQVLCLMASLETKIDPAEYEIYLQRALVSSYQKYGKELETFHIREELLNLSTNDEKVSKEKINELYNLLFSFADKDGSFYPYVNGKPQIEFKNSFVYLELDDLSSSPKLRNLVLTIISTMILKELYQENTRHVPKSVIFDEAWEILQDPIMEPVIEILYRKARKYGGSAGVITQNTSDIDRYPALKSCYSNASYKFFLYQDEIGKATVKEKQSLGKSPMLYEIYDGFQKAKDQGFSEIMINSQNTSNVLRFYVDPYSSLVYSSDADDVALIERTMKEKKCSRITAIDYIVFGKPQHTGNLSQSP